MRSSNLMKIESIDYWFSDEEEENGEATCPVCGEPWVLVKNGDGAVVSRTACPHLRFAIEPEYDSIECFNGFDLEDFIPAIEALARECGEEITGETVERFIIENRSSEEFWTSLEHPQVDTLLELTQGMPCGPSYALHFGAKLES